MAWTPPEDNERPTMTEKGSKSSRESKFRLAIAIGGVVLAAILLVVLYFVLRTEKSEEAFFSEPIRTIDITLDNGSVELTGAPTDVVAVERNMEYFFISPDISQRVEGDTLFVSQDCNFLSRCDVDFDIALPADVNVKIQSEDGAVAVRSVRGDLTLETKSGDMNIAEAFGRLELSTEGGRIDGDDLRSLDATVESADGDVELVYGSQPNRVEVTTTDGDIIVRAPDQENPYRVDASTNNGRAVVDLRTDPEAERQITARSTNGDITITRP